MGEALASDLGTLFGLGENEGALQDRLDEHTQALRAPGRFGRIEALGGFDIASERGDGAEGCVLRASDGVESDESR